ncbi:hypothetical protein BRC99_04780 [Halobacteriales archaeon QS_7_69_60]|nr:MAG: hypothetical protein BRC99_04780 [Halobacteriales archaeon QS_7_69_60]
MMTTTHALVGALVGAAVAPFAPATTPAMVTAGFAGGAAPDADLVATHRRSTHFPVAGTAAATGLAGVAVAVASPATTLLAVFAVAVAIHCLMDALAGGVERRPWEATSEEAVYNHVGGYWVRPRRWVRYAGAPEDLLLAAGAALPLLASLPSSTASSPGQSGRATVVFNREGLASFGSDDDVFERPLPLASSRGLSRSARSASLRRLTAVRASARGALVSSLLRRSSRSLLREASLAVLARPRRASGRPRSSSHPTSADQPALA